MNYVGSYIEDVKLALTASLVAHEHVILLGAPGWGKTDLAESLAREVVGEERRIFIRFAPSTPPQVVEGMFDPAAALDNPPRFVLVKDGTPYDPRALVFVADEVGRPSDIIFDRLLDVLDRRDVPFDQSPVVWGTSNFAFTSARTEALRDRFGLWHWLQPGQVDVAGVVKAHAHALHGGMSAGSMPTWEEIEDIQRADPGEKAIGVCTEILTMLAQEAAKAALIPNPRRVKQWFRLLFRTNVWLQGTADFDSPHPEASKVLTWAWPLTDENKASDWRKIASCVVDIIGTAISELKSKTLEQVKLLMNRNANMDRAELAIQLGEVITEGKREIESLNVKDARIQQALQELQDVFVKIVKGEDPFSS